MNHVVKRKGRQEPYDDRKVYASVYAACLNAHRSESTAERIADEVAHRITLWLREKATVTSDEIFRHVIKLLAERDHDAGFMYETHRDIS